MSAVNERMDRTYEKIGEVQGALAMMRQLYGDSQGKRELWRLNRLCEIEIERLEKRLKMLVKRHEARARYHSGVAGLHCP